MGFVIIELYQNYDEIFFLDEFYIWNNEKNGSIYSWFDQGEDDAYLEDDAESQVKLGVVVAISSKGQCFYNIIRKAYDRFSFTHFLAMLLKKI